MEDEAATPFDRSESEFVRRPPWFAAAFLGYSAFWVGVAAACIRFFEFGFTESVAELIVVSLVLSVIFTQSFWISGFLAFSGFGLFNRFAIFLLWLFGFSFILAFTDGTDFRINELIAALIFNCSTPVILTLLFYALKFWGGFALFGNWQSGFGRARQFGLRDLLIIATIVALCAAGIRIAWNAGLIDSNFSDLEGIAVTTIMALATFACSCYGLLCFIVRVPSLRVRLFILFGLTFATQALIAVANLYVGDLYIPILVSHLIPVFGLTVCIGLGLIMRAAGYHFGRQLGEQPRSVAA